MPQTFLQPQQPAPAAREYILTIPETQMPSSQVVQPAQQSQVASKGQQQSRVQQTSFLVIDDQQAGPSQPLTFTLMPVKPFNSPSIASATGEESQHNISGLSSFFGNLKFVMSYQQIDTRQPYSNHHSLTTGTSAATSPASSTDAKQQSQ